MLVGLLGATQLQATPASAAPAPVSLIVPTTSSVWASSAYPGAAPENAYDCDPGSPWNAGGYGGSLLAQFTQPITFNGIQLVVSALPSTAESYTFNGSNDGINWTPITSTTVGVPQGDPTLPLVTFPGVTYQYLSIDVNGGASWVAILDVRLQVSAGDNVPAVATCGTVLPSTTAQIRLTSTTPDGGTIAAGPAPSMTGTASFTAAISNTNLPALDGIPVSFSVSGANPQTLTAVTDATGTATVSYSGGTAGTDSVVAAATIDGVTIATDPRSVVWGAPPPTINDLVAGEYVDGLLTLSGSTVPGGHVRCTHSNGGDIWETDADASGVWSLQINLSGDADGEDILYVEDGSGGGYFHQYTGGAGGFPVFVDASGSGPDFHIIGGDGSNGADVYLGDASVGIQPLADGLGAPSSIRNIVWSATGDDVINWTTVAGGPCGCLPNGSIIFHRIGSRTLSYYVVDEFGHHR